MDCARAELQEKILEQLEEIFLDAAAVETSPDGSVTRSPTKQQLNKYDGEWLKKFEAYLGSPTLTMLRYEHFAQNVPALVEALARYFGVELPKAKEKEKGHAPTYYQRIAEEWSLQKVAERTQGLGNFSAFDRSTHLHGHHVSSNGSVGAWRACFEDTTLAVVDRHVGHVLAALGYEEAKGVGGQLSR